MQTTQDQETTIIIRLNALFKSVMEDADNIPQALKPVIHKMVKSYLDRGDPEQIRKIIIDIRDNVIPWILGDKAA